MVAHAFLSRFAEQRRISIGWFARGAIGVGAVILCSLAEEPPRSRLEAQPTCAERARAPVVNGARPRGRWERRVLHGWVATSTRLIAMSRADARDTRF